MQNIVSIIFVSFGSAIFPEIDTISSVHFTRVEYSNSLINNNKG